MKTIKKDSKYKRVKDKEAESLVRLGWNYCSKEEWKKKVRDKDKKS